MDSLSYEDQRLQNIRDNEALLLSLGLNPPALTTPSKPLAKKRSIPIKRKSDIVDVRVLKRKPRASEVKEENQEDQENQTSLRRSPRNVARPRRSLRDSTDELGAGKSESESERGSGSESENEEKYEKRRNNPKMGVRIHDPKTFGHIPDVPVGKWLEASQDAIHAPTVAGISGNAIDGAYSVALSGGYPDDVDLGLAFTYTGCGGRDLKGTKQNPKNLRTAPQTFDQSFDWPYNAALKRSAETRKPVRVIRGFKLDSPFAPTTGYRYDGLYIVEKAWMAKGLTKKLLVCRYAFKRVPGQPDLITREAED